MWMRVDDGLHAHRKTRAVTKSNPDKVRDAAPMGLWVLAGSWSGRNNRDGWVPRDELDRFDDEWEPLADRLVRAGYWWPEQRDGEDGFGFNDWHEWNNPDGASQSGTFGNHVRWHAKKGVVKPDCDHCPKEPTESEAPEIIAPISGASRPDDRPDIALTSADRKSRPSRLKTTTPVQTTESLYSDAVDVESAGQIGFDRPDIGCESLRDHRPESLTPTRPDPTRTRPEPKNPSSDESDHADRFDEFWDVYDKKVGRKKVEQKWRLALRKRGVTADLLIAAARAYIAWQKSEGKHPTFTKNPETWLNGEHWNDERPTTQPPTTRVQEHLTLVQRLAAEENDQPTIPQIGGGR